MTKPESEFAREARQERASLPRQIWEFIQSTKKWWLVPLIIFLLILGALIFVGGTAAGPFVYTFF